MKSLSSKIPVLASDAGLHSIIEINNTTGSTGLHITHSGTLTFADFRLTTVSASVASITWSGGATPPSGLAGVLAGALSITTESNSDSGSIVATFSAADFNFDFLATNETLTVVYNVTITDNGGVSLTRPVTITITGTNDAPVLAADASGPHTVTEALNTTGALTFTDVDLNDQHAVSTSVASATWSGGATLPNGLAAALAGALSTTTTDSTRSGSGSIAVTFSAADSAFDFLAAGQTLKIIYNVMVTDNNGVSSTQPVIITVTGTNDAPVAVADVAGVKEDTPPNPVSGNLLANDPDVDSNDTHTVSAVTGGSDNGTTITTVGTYGTLVITKATGDYTYTLANGQANVQALAEGQQVTDVFTYINSDNHGGVSSSTLTVTVTGTDNAPVAVADVAAVKEDTPPNPVSGNLLANDTDVDSTDTHTVSAVTGGSDNGTTITKVGTYGTLVVTKATGAYTYTLANGQANVQALADGQQVTDVFTYTNSDNHGGVSSSTLTVTVTGTNDAPVAVADVAAVKEDTPPNPVSGNLLANDPDVDSNDTHTVSAVTGGSDNGTTITTVGTYGTLVITKATGAYTYTLANGQANVQALVDGQQVTDAFTYTNSDNQGGSSSSTLTVTVTGTNDASVAVADVAAVKEDTPPNPVSGNLLANDTDLDSTDTHTVSAVTGGSDNGTTITTVGTYGTLVITKATGDYTYTLANGQANVQALADGQQVTDVFTYTNSDNHGGSSSSTLTVTVTGTNDAPVAVADVAAVKEDTPPNPVSGNLLANDPDVDSNDTHTVSAVTGGSDNGTTITTVGTYGTLVITKATGAYTYTLANGQANVQALVDGQQVTDAFTYTNSDNQGGSSSSTLTVTVTGTNDASVAVADVAAVKEDTPPNPVSGNLLANDTDLDSTDTHTVSAVTGGSDNGTTITKVGTYGTLVVTKATGAYTYTLANGQANVQALAEGQQVTDVFTYTNSDNHGGVSSSTLTVTVTGTNDAPVAVADVAAVKEDTPPNPVSGNLLANDPDVDSTDTHTVSAVTGGSDNGTTITTVGTYGTLVITKATGAYTYTLANGQANVQALVDGQQVTDAFTYTNSDNQGGSSSSTLTVTVTGTNDASVAVADVAAVKEDTPPNPVSGNLLANDTDLDSTDTHTVSAVTGGSDNGTTITTVGTYGTLVITKATGDYTYTLANGQANVQALADGQQVTDVFTYTNSDNHGGLSSSTLTVTVTGTNDAPVAVADVAAVKEDTPPNPVSGNLLANDPDVDSTDTHTVSAVTGGSDNGTTITTVGTYGTLVITKATGAYTYTLANGQANVQALADGQQVTDVFTYTNSDNHGGSSSSTLTVTVTGTNDAPVAVVDVAAVKEDTPPNPVSGNLLANDPDVDSTDTHTVSAVTGGSDNGTTITKVGTYGTLVVTKATGAYTYTLANGQANVQALAEGQQVTDVFTYTNSDNHGGVSSSTLTVTVTGTNDPRVIAPGEVLVLSGETLTNPLIQNDGTILVQSNATSTILGDITGTGVIEIKNNSTLVLAGSVGSELTILFSVDPGGGANSKLILDDPSDFHAKILDFDGNDQIDLRTINFAST